MEIRNLKSKSSKSNRKIYIQPYGGLGNQLFIYFAGLYLAERHNSELVLEFPLSHKSFDIHLGNISEFALHAKIEFGQLLRKTSYIEKAFSKLVGCETLPLGLRRIVGSKLKFYQQSGTGYDQALEFLQQVRFVSGYFQTWKFHDSLSQNKKEIFIESSFQELSELPEYEILRAENSIVLHIRRGDYVQGKFTNGVLSISYYCRAIETLRKLGVSSPVLIFTDDFSSVEEELISKFNFDWILADSDGQLSPSQTLQLMSLGHHFITANSTFSWWAARLSTRGGIVLVPQDWFFKSTEPVDLIPLDWIEVPSEWDFQ